MITHGLIVGANVTLDELKDKGVVKGNISIDKRDPLVNEGAFRGSMPNESGVGS
jgi:hypothetical protein